MKANPGKINFVNQNAAANVTGVLFEKLTGQTFGTGPTAVERAKKWWLAEGRTEYTFDAIEAKFKPQPVQPAPKP